ncbi:dopamine receptor 1 [Trichonephila inaurata madagascariensis]|uniref:Dopamine receptor 1 n=1 Tax=Trichonephila inaurata madagascariensis TaxID=2747483 RepID=A0A8X7CL49_9ARAC|nr:dopamine receptor 1 [Trichonephila inaurata madagascariensis]
MLQPSVVHNESLSVTSSDYDDDIDDFSDITTKCLIGIPLAIIIFMSLTGNLLVCLAIYTDRRLRKLGNLFLVSLAISDLFVSSLFGPIHPSKDPLRYGRWMTKRVVLMAIGGIWMLSALVSFLPISLGWHKPKKVTETLDEELRPTCALDLTPVYAVVSSIISFYAPCVVMVALYTRLYLYARKHVRNIRAVTKTTISSKSKSCNSSHNHHNMDHKAAITLGFIMGTFLVCWVPFFCINIVAAVCKSCISDMVFKFLTWLGYCNSALNPIIYSIFNTEFREAFRRILLTYLQAECCSISICKDNSRDRSDTRRTTLGVGNSNHHLRPPSSPLNPDPINRIEMQGEWSGKSSDV